MVKLIKWLNIMAKLMVKLIKWLNPMGKAI
jgi:hypothetical protein